MATTRLTRETLYLRHDFTDAERLQMGDDLELDRGLSSAEDYDPNPLLTAAINEAESEGVAIPADFESEVRQSMGVPEPFPSTLEEQLKQAQTVQTRKPKNSGPADLKKYHKQVSSKESAKPEVW